MTVNTVTTTATGTLELVFRNGIYGKFPVGVLKTNIGIFSCRDKWLETLDEGIYTGEFGIEEISLSGYMSRGPVREQRTFIKAVVNSYVLDDLKEGDAFSLDGPADIDDPILEETNEVKLQLVEPKVDIENQNEEKVTTKDKPQEPQLFNDEFSEMELFVREKLRIGGSDGVNWKTGQSLTIPADLERTDQRMIRDYLVKNGYKMTNPMKRLWEVESEATNV